MYAIWEYIYRNASEYEKYNRRYESRRPTGDIAFNYETARRQLKRIQDDHSSFKRHREGQDWISFRNLAIYHYQIEEY